MVYIVLPYVDDTAFSDSCNSLITEINHFYNVHITFKYFEH